MKNRIYIVLILAVFVGGGFFWRFNSGSSVSALTDRDIIKSINTTKEKKITVISKSKHDGGWLVFYVDSPPISSGQYNLEQTDVGFAYFTQKNNVWSKDHSGEYGSIRSYLKQTGKGYTYEFYPSDPRSVASLLFGVISDSQIEKIRLTENDQDREMPVHYVDHGNIRIWYSFLEAPLSMNVTVATIGGGESVLSEKIINLKDYDFSKKN